MAAAGGSDDCPPPPPPPPPNNNNNNNKPNDNTEDDSRPDELPDELSDDNFAILLGPQAELNNNLQEQMQMLSLENGFLLGDQLEDELEPEPEQIQIPCPEYSEEEEEDDDDLELQGAAAAPSPTIFFEDECPEDIPDKFDGNPDTLGAFMSQCQVFMERSSRDFSADRIRVCFVTSMLTGRAARWASAKLERANYLLHNYPAFMMEMKHVFEDPQRREAAKRKIRRLRQGLGSVVDYANAFQMIAQDLDWNEPALVDQFQEGLSDQMQEALSHEEVPKTLSDLIDLCIDIERRMTNAAIAAAANKPPPPGPW